MEIELASLSIEALSRYPKRQLSEAA